MCGIFAYSGLVNYNCTGKEIRHRGPDEEKIIALEKNERFNYMEFHRLKINGLSPDAMQPICFDSACGTVSTSGSGNVFLLANGEIYNHRELTETYKLNVSSNMASDCEVILHLYNLVGIKKTAELLDGEFAFCIFDLDKGLVHAVKDQIGIRSLYYLINAEERLFAVSSEMKGFKGFNELKGFNVLKDFNQCKDFKCQMIPNRCIATYNMSSNTINMTDYDCLFTEWSIKSVLESHTEHETALRLSSLLEKAVIKKLMCDSTLKDGSKAIGAFLSGGFDSSVIAALVKKHNGLVHTFSIGFADSPDLLAARSVAKYIDSIHHEYVVTKEFMLEILKTIVKQIESPDITTCRASAFMLALSMFIKRDFPEIKVIFSGEGADEASGSYMYFRLAPDDESFYYETMRLLDDLRYFDVLRGDMTTAAYSLELRVPFLDRDFLKYYMTVSRSLKFKEIEKYILRRAMTYSYITDKTGRQLLPDSIIWRKKEALSDGVSLHNESWFEIIQSHLRLNAASGESGASEASGASDISGISLEREYYMNLFLKEYGNFKNVFHYYWLPQWSNDSDDPSARTLKCYDIVPEI